MAESIFRTAEEGWRVGLRSIVVMPYLSGTTFLLFLGCLVADFLVHGGPAPAFALNFKAVPLVLVHRILVTTIEASTLIAVHRFAMLGEVVDRPVWSLPPIFRRFAVWLLFLNLFALLPEILLPLMSGLPAIGKPGPAQDLLTVFVYGPIVLAMIAALVFAVILDLRLMLLLPAIALVKPSAGWRNAWSDSRGHAWRFLGAHMVALLPLVAIGGFVSRRLLGLHAPAGFGLGLSALEALLMCYVTGAVTSRLYWLHGARLTR